MKKSTKAKTATATKNGKEYSIEKYLLNFNSVFGKTTEAVYEMGQIYCDAIRHYPDTARKEFAERFPQVRNVTWEALELIGNDKLNPKAIFLSHLVRKEVASLPIDLQNKIFKGDYPSFKVVNPITMKVEISNIAEISPIQAKVLFDKDEGRIRSVDEQKVYLKNNPIAKTDKEVKKGSAKYAIVSNKVVIGGIKFSLAEIDAIRKELYEAVFG